MDLLQKIENKEAVIGVVGLGYVGLPLLMEFVDQGFKTIGFDIDPQKVEKLNAGKSYIKHIDEARVKKVRDSNLFEATTDFSRIKEVDAILICVPTPLTKHREPDLSYITGTGETLAQHIRAGQLIVLESSTFPGTTEEVLKPLLEKSGLKGDRDFWVAFSPEREDPANPKFNTRTIPKVVGANNEYARKLVSTLYDQVIVKTVPVSSTQAAEATKLLENIFRSVNIALVNEMKMILDRMGIDVWEVIEAASTKPFGFMPFYPGPGLGGHCIPIDPFYLTWKAREYEMNTRFIELAGEVNTFMPYYVVNRVTEALNDRAKSVKGSKILILGAAYKKDVDDPRESPTFKLIEILEAKGAIVDYNDPLIPVLPKMRMYHVDHKESVDLTPENLKKYDLVLISTDHSIYDWDFIVENAQLVVDTRNATKNVLEHRDKIVKA
ncbi:nucleotide sugar dehydrogenase [Caldithrix abyssi]|uniref:Nucleotide sugar dehydrogenase n=1 Tax=Caldithrix abyssi DSM 13497 TaxID=880073 RepID=H1XXK4_CALAY|nr:nucleotide sugar dehydrogenase [Caldithrix abyssi]APF19217.1 UDP-N-acetyl-D-glucosamine dehydrogenase [Caldithrix abyssi DSM 13497]EHO43128.1 nucleotide sugar dehydrogenase [Caldithrix abyssi DSM 13497]